MYRSLAENIRLHGECQIREINTQVKVFIEILKVLVRKVIPIKSKDYL